jgi:hypothetical protein
MSDKIVGHYVVKIRKMTEGEMEAEGWDLSRLYPPTVLELDNGTCLYASRDDEGNGPGTLFGFDAHGKTFGI